MNDDIWGVKTYDARKLIVIGEDGELAVVEINQDTVESIRKYFEVVEENMNG